MKKIMLGFLIGVVVAGSALIAAQEKPARPMRSWQLGVATYAAPNLAKITVFDTEGVCLYVVTAKDYNRQINGFGESSTESQSMFGAVAIAAVSKKDLPLEAGCQ